MANSLIKLVLAGSLLACLGSFGWAMTGFFTKPTGSNRLIKLLSVAGIVSGVLHLEAITHAHQMEWQRISISLLLYFAAFCTFWWTVRTNSSRPLSAIFSDDAPVHLVTSGPYRIVRHPFYCSYLLTWLAGVVATGGPWLVLTFLMMLGIYVRAAQAEERKFSSTLFAQAFQRYHAEVGFLFPNPAKLLKQFEGLVSK